MLCTCFNYTLLLLIKAYALHQKKINIVVKDQARHKPSCTSTKDDFRLEIWDLRSRNIVLFPTETAKVLISVEHMQNVAYLVMWLIFTKMAWRTYMTFLYNLYVYYIKYNMSHQENKLVELKYKFTTMKIESHLLS